ncbi:SKI family transcriptional corepressor 1a isoform X1 [Astyanax mexicanus]|uniref:SKI family transcriptional corepressor 1a isoform X1 n=1 Tax=Astyanax mexicanus TaxID=7994 RepID=UPI0020CB5173|nr:SKI family transcriptional corepressor 1a isoform X1 [Astyanax mexicanus]
MEALSSPLPPVRDSSSSPRPPADLQPFPGGGGSLKANTVSETCLYGVPIVSLLIDGQERLCLAQISNTLLKSYSYNEIHNRRVALGITCVQCTPVQLEILRRAGAMPVSSRRCGMITKREAERLCKSFLGAHSPPKLPENFAFDVSHECAFGCRGSFIPARYNSSRAKCIKCAHCGMYFSPNKFIFHSHRAPDSKYTQPDAANFNSWRRHLKLSDKTSSEHVCHAWEDVKAMFNGGSRKRTVPFGGSESRSPMGALRAGGGGGGGASPELARKTPRCSSGSGGSGADSVVVGAEDERAISGIRAPSYPLVPLPSKGFGALHKLHAPFFPHPYGGFPTFGACQKKDGTGVGVGGGGSGGDESRVTDTHKVATAATAAAAAAAAAAAFWPGAKDAALYPAFPVFWPTAGGLHVPAYPHQAQARLKAHTDLAPELRESERIGVPVGAGGGRSPPGESERERERWTDDDRSGEETRSRDSHVSHVSAFRPVLRDAESIAKLYGHREARAVGPPAGHLSPELASSSSSYRSVSPDVDSAEEPDVDVESNRAPEDEEELQHSPLREPHRPAEEEPPQVRSASSPEPETGGSTEEEPRGETGPDRDAPACEVCEKDTAVCLNPALVPAPPRYPLSPPQESHRSSKSSVVEECEAQEQLKETGMEVALRTENRFHFIQKDFQNMAKEELQKQLVEQMELRKKMEREFQSLKDHFQDQMKRELSYREEMVQQLHIVRDTLCNELDQERKARYAIQQKLKAHDAIHHFSCKMLTPRHCTGTCTFKPPLLPP